MKIRCDVCEKEEASVFCSADEAALCDGCDQRVHHANKLASKHMRFSLLHPKFKESPLCDICQERRAFLFCQEDRAILCRECDIPIHKANEHTQKHNRFLLTGVKLSPNPSLNPSSISSSSSNAYNTTTDHDTKNSSHSSSSLKKSRSLVLNPCTDNTTTYTSPTNYKADDFTSETGSASTSSISEYLMETLPGWLVDDLLNPSSSSANGFCKTHDNLFLQSVDQDVESNMSSFSSEDFAIWVPQFYLQSPQAPMYLPQAGFPNGFKEPKEAKKLSWKWNDEGFTVPQVGTKSRHFQ